MIILAAMLILYSIGIVIVIIDIQGSKSNRSSKSSVINVEKCLQIESVTQVHLVDAKK